MVFNKILNLNGGQTHQFNIDVKIESEIISVTTFCHTGKRYEEIDTISFKGKLMLFHEWLLKNNFGTYMARLIDNLVERNREYFIQQLS